MLNKILHDMEQQVGGSVNDMISQDPELAAIDVEMYQASSKLENLFMVASIVEDTVKSKAEDVDLEAMNDSSLNALASSAITTLKTVSKIAEVKIESYELESEFVSGKEKYRVAINDLEGVLDKVKKKIKEWWTKLKAFVKKWWNKLWGKDEKKKSKENLEKIITNMKDILSKDEIKYEDLEKAIGSATVIKFLLNQDNPSDVYNGMLQLNGATIVNSKEGLEKLNKIADAFKEDNAQETYKAFADEYSKLNGELRKNPGSSVIGKISKGAIKANINPENVWSIGISTVSSPGDQKKYKVDTGIFKGVPTFVTSKDGIKPKGFLGETSIEGTVLTEKSDEKAKEEFVKKAKAFKLDEFAKEVEAAFKILDEVKDLVGKSTDATEGNGEVPTIEQIKMAYFNDYVKLSKTTSAAIKTLIKF